MKKHGRRCTATPLARSVNPKRPFAVKVINHLGDEVMKVFKI